MWIIRKKRERSLLERIRRPKSKWRWLMWMCIWGLVGILAGLFFVIYTFWNFSDGLIARDRLVNRQFRGLIMYDKNGKEIYKSGVEYRSGDVKIGMVPMTLKEATVSVEDKDFYRHVGFSIPSIVRAFFANAQEGEVVQGASTITQQLVKNALLGDASIRYVRKMREVVLAFAIEYRYSKDELLELYLNSIYYGRGAWGVGDAAQIYFGKDVKDLNDAECSFLAGLPQSPSVYMNDMKKARERQKQVVLAMIGQNKIDKVKGNEWMNYPLLFAEYRPFVIQHPFFTIQVKQELIEMLGIEDQSAISSQAEDVNEQLVARGLRVYTTIDPKAQELGEMEVRRGVEELMSRNVQNGAALVLDAQNGAVRAMVGSKDWNDERFGQVNILYSMQQPGSTLKPLIYASALQDGAILSSTLFGDVRKDFGGGYIPVNYDGKYRGAVNLRRALANSLNVPAVEALNKLGIDNGVNYLVKMGMRSLERKMEETSYKEQENYNQYYGLSLALGGYEVVPMEVMGAFGVLARGGSYMQPYLIEKIVDRFGNVVYVHSDAGVSVIDKRYTDLIADIMADNDARKETFGTRVSNLEIPGKKVSVKTGTTTDYRDSWAVGFDSRYVVGVWVGNNDNSAMAEVAGSVGGASIWKRVMMGL